MNRTSTNKLVQIALIGALYTALTFASAPVSFGTVQLRFSEALTLLPLFSPVAIWGLTFGCFFSNLLGFVTGLNPLGLIDALVGTVATLLAALATRKLWQRCEKHPRLGLLLAPLPPVLFNGLLVGLELTILFAGHPELRLFLVNGGSVALGEAVICYLPGLLLVRVLRRNDFHKKILPPTR